MKHAVGQTLSCDCALHVLNSVQKKTNSQSEYMTFPRYSFSAASFVEVEC